MTEAQRQFGNLEIAEHLPLETVTGRLVKIQQAERT
jgi:hypothetical protein